MAADRRTGDAGTHLSLILTFRSGDLKEKAAERGQLHHCLFESRAKLSLLYTLINLIHPKKAIKNLCS